MSSQIKEKLNVKGKKCKWGIGTTDDRQKVTDDRQRMTDD